MTFLRPATVLVSLLALSLPAAAHSVTDFYRGKQTTLIATSSPGGDYDLRGGMLRVIWASTSPARRRSCRNMPGAAGLQAINWLANVAPRDAPCCTWSCRTCRRTSRSVAAKWSSMPPSFWIGNTTNSPNVVNSWHTTGVRTVEEVQAREVVVGAPGTATSSVYYPKAMNAVIGTKFKIVSGYPGGNDVNLAMERGEVGGRGSSSWASWSRPSRNGSPRGKSSSSCRSRSRGIRSLPTFR